MDMRGMSSVTDFMVLGTALNTPHIKALEDSSERALRKLGAKPYRVSGDAASGWIALDYVDVVGHIFVEETRSRYALEELWKDARLVTKG